MGYVFISYSSKNKDSADAIKNLLNKNHIDTWMAPNDIPAGSKYASVIGSSIKNCACLLLLLTNDSQKSVWVAKEVERAINYKKVIIPVQLENVVLNDEFEMYISTDQITLIKKIDEATAEIQRLLSAVGTYVGAEIPANSAAAPKKSKTKIAEGLSQTGVIPIPLPLIEIGEVIDGKYTVLKKIDEGHIFTVFLALNEASNKQWALKVIYKPFGRTNTYAQKILQQLPMIKMLDYPGIPRIVDVIDTEERLILVTDYIEGSSLLTVIQEDGAQPEAFVGQAAMQLACIVGHLHSRSILLCDALNPDNIMVKPDGSVALISLRSVWKTEDAASNITVSTGEFGKEDLLLTKESDLYSLGKLLYYTVTGLDPNRLSHKMRPVRKINPKLSKGIEYIISKATAPNPKKRYQNAEEMLLDLENFLLADFKLRLPPILIKALSVFKKRP